MTCRKTTREGRYALLSVATAWFIDLGDWRSRNVGQKGNSQKIKANKSSQQEEEKRRVRGKERYFAAVCEHEKKRMQSAQIEKGEKNRKEGLHRLKSGRIGSLRLESCQSPKERENGAVQTGRTRADGNADYTVKRGKTRKSCSQCPGKLLEGERRKRFKS